MSPHILDGDRLLADLQAAGEVLHAGEWPNQVTKYYELRGMERAWRILIAAVEDGEYDTTLRDTPSTLYWPYQKTEIASRASVPPGVDPSSPVEETP
ncbi:MAG: hypothetical protein ACRDIC_06055 [bacterium]